MQENSATKNRATLRSYRLDPEGFAGLRKRVIIAIGVMLPFLFAGAWYFDGHDKFDLVLLPVILTWAAYKTIRKQQRHWESVRFELGADKLVIRRQGYVDREIAQCDVSQIVESGKGLVIQTSSRLKKVFISRHLLDYQEFRTELRAWAPFVPVAGSLRAWIRAGAALLGFFTLFLIGPFYLMSTSHKELVLPLGIALVLANAAMFMLLERYEDVPKSFRYTRWALPGFSLLATIFRLFLK
jgi:hypothetical protein